MVQPVLPFSVREECRGLEPGCAASGKLAGLRNSGFLWPARLSRGGERAHLMLLGALCLKVLSQTPTKWEASGRVWLSNKWGPVLPLFAFAPLLAAMFPEEAKPPITHALYKLISAKSQVAQLPWAISLLQPPLPTKGGQAASNLQFHPGFFSLSLLSPEIWPNHSVTRSHRFRAQSHKTALNLCFCL